MLELVSTPYLYGFESTTSALISAIRPLVGIVFGLEVELGVRVVVGLSGAAMCDFIDCPNSLIFLANLPGPPSS